MTIIRTVFGISAMLSCLWVAGQSNSAITTDDSGEAFYEAIHEINKANLPPHSSTDWYKEMQSAKPNVWKAKRLFEDYKVKYPYYHSKNRRRFEAWLQQVSLNADANGNILPVPADALIPSPAAANRSGTSSLSANVGSWRSLGPVNLDPALGPCGNNTIVSGGFVDRVYINPYNTNNMIAGMSYGGLHVSSDGGSTWTLTDAMYANGTNTYANRDTYYGDIIANASNSNLLYAATEAGLLKSINGGLAWSLCPTLNRTATPNNRPYYVAQKTNDVNIVLSTFGKKLYRSADAGNTWTVVYDNSAGGSNHNGTNQHATNTYGFYERNYNFFGLVADYGNADVFYIGAWNISNEPCIYKSTDAGLTFTLLKNLNILLTQTWGAGNHLILKTIGSQPNKFYVVEQFKNPSPLYRISDAGALISSTTINYEVEAFDIDWNNENTIWVSHYSSGYAAGDYVKKSIDGGATLTDPIGSTPNCGWLHPDMRNISAVGNKVLLGNDAGLGITTDGGLNIKGTGFEINSPDIWGFSSSPRGDRLLAGLDHNQTFVRNTDVLNGWKNIKGGDAGPCTINTNDDHWLYFDWAYGVNKGYISDAGVVTEYPSAGGINYSSIQTHPQLVYKLFAISGSKIMGSADNLTSVSTFKDFGTGNTVNKVRIARRDPKIFYALLNSNNIQKSIDSGATWTTISPTTTESGGQTNISSLEVGKLPGEVWLSYANFQTAGKVLYSINGGASWTNITGSGLPTIPIEDISYQRGTNGLVYVNINTLNGGQIWYKDNSSTTWTQLGNNLPTMGFFRDKPIPVPQKGVLRLGSSRGSWEHALPQVSKTEASFALDNDQVSCSNAMVQFRETAAYGAGTATFDWSFPGGNPATSTLANPLINYPGAPGYYSATLKVTDAAGNIDIITNNNIVWVKPSVCNRDTIAGKMATLPGNGTIIPLTSSSINSNTFTVTMWAKPNGLQKVFSQLFSTNAPNSRFGIGISFPGYTDNLNLTVTHDNVSYGQQSNINLADNEWNHIACTYSPDGIRLYLNGGTPWYFPLSSAAIMNFTNSPLNINKDIHSGQGSNFKGQIDELKVFNYVLTQQEIRENMHLISSSEPGLVTYYQFNQFDAAAGSLYEILSKNQSIVTSDLITNSNAPVASGVSHRISSVNTPGSYTFGNTDVKLSFPGPTVPNGEMVISKLYSPAFDLPTGYSKINGQYWIVRNWGTNNTFTALTDFTIQPMNISAADAATPSLLKLIKRPSNGFLMSEWGTSCSAAAAVSGPTGSVSFNASCGINSFSQFLLATNGSSVLPVVLTAFTAEKFTGSKALLRWSVASEINNHHFEILRSADGINWLKIGQIPSLGTGSNTYQFLDAAPVSGINYYRLRWVSANGSGELSQIRKLQFDVNESLSIFPQPANANVWVSGMRTATDKVYVYTTDGKKLNPEIAVQNLNTIKINTQTLPNGTYIIMVNDRGLKLIVNH